MSEEQDGAARPEGPRTMATAREDTDREDLGSLPQTRSITRWDRTWRPFWVLPTVILHQDPAFGIRKLVDIGERALSPGINDPTTAVQVLDELHRILRLVVVRAELPALITRDGRVRLVHRPQRVEQLVDLALAEPLHYGKDSLQVPRRMLVVLEDLLTVALPEHQPRLRGWLETVRAQVTRAGEGDGQ